MLTLFPIHALGLRTIAAANKKKKKKKKKQQNDADTEFVAYDSDRDGKYFASDNQEAGLRMKLNIPLDSSQPALSVLGGDRRNKVLFAMTYREYLKVVRGRVILVVVVGKYVLIISNNEEDWEVTLPESVANIM